MPKYLDAVIKEGEEGIEVNWERFLELEEELDIRKRIDYQKKYELYKTLDEKGILTNEPKSGCYFLVGLNHSGYLSGCEGIGEPFIHYFLREIDAKKYLGILKEKYKESKSYENVKVAKVL